MTSARFDSVIISIDWISFRYLLRRDFRAYMLVVTADTNGTIGIYESPESYSILHRPQRDKPATIDFGFDGFIIYSSTGAVPDLVRFDAFVVKEPSKGVRRAGAVRDTVRNSPELLAKVQAAKAALASASSGGARAAQVAMAVAPVLEMVGGVVEGLAGKVIEAYSGSKIFDGALVARAGEQETKQISQAVVSPTGNIETKVDITLFERQEGSGPPPELDASDPLGLDPNTVERPDPRPPRTQGERAPVPIDPANVVISLRRPRVLYGMGWVTAALVPLSLALAAATADKSEAVTTVAMVLVALGVIFSPAMIYGAGRWARARVHKKGLTRLGWVAVIFHLLSLGCIALGIVLAAGVLAAAKEAEPTSFGEGLGIILGSVVGAAVVLTVMIGVSLLPWLVSIITGVIFGRRATRKSSHIT